VMEKIGENISDKSVTGKSGMAVPHRNPRSEPNRRETRPALLVFFVVRRGRLQILSFADQAAIEALDVIHAIPPGDNYGAAVLTGSFHGLHKANMALF
jgi:hypothetical protein